MGEALIVRRGGGISVKSIQSGIITIASSATSATATISSVDVNKTVLMFNGLATNASSPNSLGYINLTDSTTITATRGGAPVITGGITEISYTVVEFDSVKSIQSGIITIASSATSATATISSVDVNQAILFFNGSLSSQAYLSMAAVHIKLTDSTTVTATRKGTGVFTSIVPFCVVEI